MSHLRSGYAIAVLIFIGALQKFLHRLEALIPGDQPLLHFASASGLFRRPPRNLGVTIRRERIAAAEE
jgi:hypothetical protein